MVSVKDVIRDVLDPTSVIEVPLLRRGRHLDPRKGASLLELTATVTGDVWTDRPAGVHRTLLRDMQNNTQARISEALDELSAAELELDFLRSFRPE